MANTGAYQPEAGHVPVAAGIGAHAAGARVWLAGVLAFLLLIGAGIAYRVAASGLQRFRDNPVSLPMPLSMIPLQLYGWAGEENPLDTTTDEYMRENFADDYVSRRYRNATVNALADVYVVYCSSYTSGLLGHRPDVCFPAHGWIRDHTTPTEVTTRTGQKIPCLSHQFHKAAPAYGQVFVLSFYVLNGRITLREGDFAGIFDRTPNISGDPAHYVAQVQISSIYERSVELAARDMVDTILTFLPDRQGRVKAASSVGPADGNQADRANR